jgi:hypothetical protein
MSTYRCEAGHTTERLTECTGFKHKNLGNHVPAPTEFTRTRGLLINCRCGASPAPTISCPVTTRESAPDALTIPPMCGQQADLQ